jgi:hypothetical protein
VISERSCFGECRDRDRTVKPFGLDLRDLDALVCLDVRAKANIVTLRDFAHSLGVTSNAGYVEEKRWCA